MISFRKFISVSAVAILGVTNLLTPLSYANAATYDDYDAAPNKITAKSFSFIMPNHDVFLYAVTEANKYFVKYEGNTHTSGEMGTETFTYDQTGHLAPNAFAKTGYTWSGWNTNSGGTGTGYSSGAAVWNWTTTESGVVPIYAQWKANGYNISYDLNDTDGTSTAVHSKTPNHLNYDETGTILNPTRTGYTFSGWNVSGMDSESHIVGGQTTNATSVDEVYGTSFKNLLATSGTVEFLAQWTRKADTKYDVNHYTEKLGTGWKLEETDHLSGVTDTEVKPSTHTYTGFTKRSDTPHSGNIAADGSTVFDYYYTRNSYNLTLVAGRGIAQVSGSGSQNTTGGSDDESVTISFKYEEPVNVHYELKPGYTGASWSGYQDAASTFNMLATGGTKTASATPIVYTITYNTKSGYVSPAANPTSYTVESGNITLTNPNREHSKFAGWTGTDLSGPTMTVTIASGSIGNRSYTATWTCLSGYKLNADQTACIPRDDTEYSVKHLFQNLTGDNYDLVQTTHQTGATESDTDAQPIAHEGFTIKTTEHDVITGDGSTEVKIRYDRNSYTGTIANPVGVEPASITTTAEGAHPTTAGKYKYGDTVTINATLVTGYTFGGWTVKDASGTTITVTNSSSLTNATFTMPANSVTITPTVTKVTYNITYDLNSGSVAGTNPATYDVETATITLNNPERDHSVFVGWSGTDISGTSGTVKIAKGSVGDRSYEAIWRCATGYHAVGNSCVANEYHGTVEYDDGEHSSPEQIDFTYDQYTTLPNPTQSGYDFAGWDIIGMSGDVEHYIGTLPVTGSSYSGATVTGYMNLSTDEGATDIVFRAKWTPRDDTKYVIYHYYKDLGTNTYFLSGTDNLTGTTDTEVVFAEKLKNKSGFTYSGGYLNGGTTRPTTGKVTTGNIEKDGSTKIYLYYDRNRLTVYLSGDAHVATLTGAGTYEYGDTVTVDMSAKTGYHFKEWQKKSNSSFN